jgi:glycosyltransferase involved in cell wall biosynthesis
MSSETPESSRPLRVLMIAPTSFFADYGCHVRILEEAQTLQALGHSVTIATYHNGGPVAGLDIRRSLWVPGRRSFEVGSSRHKIAFDALLGARVLGLLARGRYDLIHGHLHEGALIGQVLGRMFGVPCIFDFQGSMTYEMLDHGFLKKGGRAHALFGWIERQVNAHSPLILSSSQHARRWLVEEFGCPEDRVLALPDAVNTDVFVPATRYAPAHLQNLRSLLGISPDRRLVVYLGLLAEYQGTGLLLEAMRHLLAERPQTHLLLMGFPNLELYQQRSAELGLGDHVTFTGRVPYARAPELLALGDVAVSPKLSLTEGAGKLLNYMSVGLPTVAFDTPVAREFLGADGIFAVPGDAQSLAQCLIDALYPANAAEERSLRQRADRLRRRAIQQFSWSKAGLELTEYYEMLLRGQNQEVVAA